MRLSFDHWTDDTCNNIEIQGPGWPEVEAAIQNLDQDSHTGLSLTCEENGTFMIAGGRGRYVVSFDTANVIGKEDIYWTLIDPCKPMDDPSKEELILSGQPGLIHSYKVVKLETALQAARYFFKDGKPDPKLGWIKK